MTRHRRQLEKQARHQQIIHNLDFLMKRHLVDGTDALVAQAQSLVRFDCTNRAIERELAQKAMDAQNHEACVSPFHTVPSDGEIVLGRSLDDRIVRIPVERLKRPTAIVAPTGKGKTTLAMLLTLERVALNTRTDSQSGTWLFDLKKSGLRALEPWFAQIGVPLAVATGRQLSINPLEVPAGCDSREYASIIAESIGSALLLPMPSTRLLTQMIFRLYWQRGVLEGSQDFPVVHELREEVAKTPRTNSYERDAILNRLDPLILALGNSFATRRGWNNEQLSTRSILLDLGSESNRHQDFIVTTLLTQEFMRRRASPGEHSDLWLLLDDAQQLVQPDSSLAGWIAVIRALNLSVCINVQSSEIAQSIKSNIANLFVSYGSCIDVDALTKGLLNFDERRWVSRNLPVGRFLGYLGSDPFVFQAPYVDWERGPTHARSLLTDE